MATSEKNKICCFSGHRQIAPEHAIKLPSTLTSLLHSLIERGFHTFRAGGAVGFDTICALKVLEIKKEYDELDIRLELCLPCRDQSSTFNAREKTIYNYILERADSISYACDSYRPGCMYQRNRMLVDGAQLCVAYLTSSKGGTAYTAAYALANELEFINLYDTVK